MLSNLKRSSVKFYDSVSTAPGAGGRPYFNIPGLDVDGAIKRLANRWDFYDRLVSRFYVDHLDFFDRLHQQEVLDNHEIVHRMLHSLKGISGTIGATELFELASQAEKSYRNGQDDALVLISKAEVALANLQRQLVSCNCFSIR